jgi:SAM-dependent methyltransferase
LQSALSALIHQFRQEGRPVHILDIAAGHGRYVLKTLANINETRVTAVCCDIEDSELLMGTRLAREAGLNNVRFEKGDAFNIASLEMMKLNPDVPDVVIVSGLYELYGNNNMVRKSLRDIHQLLNEDGYLVFTNQPHHPQLELIARTLINRHKQPWVMRLRSQGEMNMLVREAGFEVMQMLMDDYGIFSVSIAKKIPAGSNSQLPLSLVQND